MSFTGINKMIFTQTKLRGAFIIDLKKLEDDRGFFARTFCLNEFKDHGIDITIVQANTNLSAKKRTIRGMHYQLHPYEEDKVVRCTKGALFDVIIDLRKDSPTYKQWLGVELSEDNHRGLFVPKGFAHGFLTLKDNTEANYLVSQFYAPGAEGGIRFNDPQFGIEWPFEPIFVSDKDRNHPDYKEQK